jgi:hypothetical protein
MSKYLHNFFLKHPMILAGFVAHIVNCKKMLNLDLKTIVVAAQAHCQKRRKKLNFFEVGQKCT